MGAASSPKLSATSFNLLTESITAAQSSGKGEKVTVSDFKTGPVARRLYDALAGIQWGTAPDPFGWTVEVK